MVLSNIIKPYMDSLRVQDHPHQRRSRRDNPSFSSTLLDAIYRSIDESNGNKAGGGVDRELIYYKETMRKKQHGNGLTTRGRSDEEMDIDSSTRSRACIIERWMEKKVSFEKKDVVRRKSMPADNSSSLSPAAVLLNSSSSSSESSCGGGFSSSESDSMYGSRSRSSSCYSMQKPKPIRTSISSSSAERNYNVSTQKKQQPKSDHQGGFVKTKSKALKIYSDLKKVKQPISPGGRLASFLNSLFTAGNAKKAKILKPEQPESACSSASSFSRSCLSKTPSSRGKLSNNGAKRSVRFYPVSVIVDEDSRPCGHKNLYENEQTVASNIVIRSSPSSTHHINEELQYHVMSESQRVEEAARELLKNYQKKKEFKQMRGICTNDSEVFDDDDDDAESYASSDLFELDNLSAIGIERYREELPVYETTHLGTNRAIASGLIL